MSIDPGDDSGSICIGCGLCCDGTVVTHLAVRDESDLGTPLRALGVELLVAADPPVFALPCPAVSDGVCTIHDLHRPSACSQFECAVSRSVLDGARTRDEARSIIAVTFEMRDEVGAGRMDRQTFERHLDAVFRIRS